MSGGFDAQIGFVDEVTYGTAVAVTKFVEFNSESIQGNYERIESNSLRAGSRFQREARWAPNPKGAGGSLEFEVQSKGFAWFLKHMLGVTSTSTVAETVVYTHTGTTGTLNGDKFTCQVGRPDSGDVIRPFTYAGGKIAGWELGSAVDGLLMAKLDMDFRSEATTGAGAMALQTASYPTGTEMLSFVGGTASIGGSVIDVYDASVKVDNGLKTDRYYMNATTSKKEPLESSLRTGEVSMRADFTDLTQYNRVISTTTAGATAAVVLKWEGAAILQGASTLKALVEVTVPSVRFDGSTPNVTGPELLELPLTGKILAPEAGTSPITVVVKSLEATL